jgi:hypothetical protein
MKHWLPGEEWRAVTGAPGYWVSNLGRVQNRRGKLLSGTTNSQGYRVVNLSVDGKATNTKIHRLVCAAFNGEPPAGREIVRHLNDDRADNRAENLAWGTFADNVNDARKNGKLSGRDQRMRVQLVEITPTGRKVLTRRQAADYCGVSLSQFKEHAPALGIRPFRFMGKVLYRVVDLDSVLESAWRQSISGDAAGISAGSMRTIAGTGIRLVESPLLTPEQLLLNTASGN